MTRKRNFSLAVFPIAAYPDSFPAAGRPVPFPVAGNPDSLLTIWIRRIRIIRRPISGPVINLRRPSPGRRTLPSPMMTTAPVRRYGVSVNCKQQKDAYNNCKSCQNVPFSHFSHLLWSATAFSVGDLLFLLLPVSVIFNRSPPISSSVFPAGTFLFFFCHQET